MQLQTLAATRGPALPHSRLGVGFLLREGHEEVRFAECFRERLEAEPRLCKKPLVLDAEHPVSNGGRRRGQRQNLPPLAALLRLRRFLRGDHPQANARLRLLLLAALRRLRLRLLRLLLSQVGCQLPRARHKARHPQSQLEGLPPLVVEELLIFRVATLFFAEPAVFRQQRGLYLCTNHHPLVAARRSPTLQDLL